MTDPMEVPSGFLPVSHALEEKTVSIKTKQNKTDTEVQTK